MCTVLTALLTTSTSLADLSDGLIAYYRFDGTSGTVVDETGNYDGANYGATRGVAGRFGNAFSFDGYGSNGYVDTIPQADIPSVMTISMWVLPSGQGQLWGTVESPSSGMDGYVAQNSANPVDDELVKLAYFTGHARGPLVVTADHTVPLHTWSFLTFTIDSSSIARIYVDSVEEASGSLIYTPTSHDRALMIGQGARLQTRPFDGLIDDVRIYNRALSSAEVHDLYVVPVPGAFLLGMIGLSVAGVKLRKRT